MSQAGRPPCREDVVVELVRLGVDGDRLRWTSDSAGLGSGQAPDDLARRLSGTLGTRIALHSTSWRYARGRIVLTYALFPAAVLPTWEAVLEHVVTGHDAVHPAPDDVGDAHVAAHAVRHLADLADGRDPHLTALAARDPAPWSLLAAHAAGVHVHLGRQQAAAG